MSKLSESMNAAFLLGPRNVVVKETNIPKPKFNEVLVRVRACAICPSDVRYYAGYKQYLPYGDESVGLSGHEWAGEVVAVGEGVKNIEIGEKVVPDHLIYCGKCGACIRGYTNLCDNKKNYLRGFAEYAVAYAPNVYKMPDNVSFVEISVTEPLSCCINANEMAGISPGDVVAIIGAGPIGLMHLQLSKLSGARVISLDLKDERLELAKQLGADDLINPSKEDPVEAVKSLTDGYGADVVIVATGGAKPIELGIELAGKAGKVILFAGTYPPTTISIDPNKIHYRQLIITGSYDHLPKHFAKAINLISTGKVKVKPFISHILPLEKLREGFEIVEKRGGLKVVITP